MTLESKLLQRPILQRIFVVEIIDGKAVKSLLLVNGEPKSFKNRVYHLGRCAAETRNVNIGSGFFVNLRDPFVNSVVNRELCPSFVYLHAIKLDHAACYVLRPFEDDLGLVRHAREREVVDGKVEGV